jgi:hypothetical protein
MGKRGPQPRGPYPGRRSVTSWRMRPETRDRLERAAEKSGRSMSQEIEDRLQRTFEDDKAMESFGGERIYAVMRLFSLVIDATRPRRVSREAWLEDPLLFDRAVKGIAALLELIRPPGPVPAERERLLGGFHGEAAAHAVLLEVQLANSMLGSLDESKLTRIRAALRTAAEAAKPFGRTKTEAERDRQFTKRLAALRRKKTLTDEERREEESLMADKRLVTLEATIDELKGDEP